jgi:hypothetical protein
MKSIELVKMAKTNKIADIYTYKEAPTDPVPLGSWIISFIWVL